MTNGEGDMATLPSLCWKFVYVCDFAMPAILGKLNLNFTEELEDLSCFKYNYPFEVQTRSEFGTQGFLAGKVLNDGSC